MLNHQKLKLQSKFFLYFSGLVIIVIIFVLSALFYFQKQALLKQAQEKAFGLTSTLAYTSLNAILANDYLVVQLLIDSMMDDPDITSIALIDTTGLIIAASVPEMRGQKLYDPITQKAINSKNFMIQKISDKNNNEIWDTAVPIFNFNRRIGTARIQFSIEDPYLGLISTLIGVGIIAIIASLGVAYKFSQSISHPIKKVVNLAGEYGKGNFDASINIVREDEIGELITSLNKLSHELKTHIDEKIANENLVMMGEFASYIIHDLKNPLSGIHLLSDGMLRKVPDDSPMKKYATEILLASQKLHDFVERTLDIARWSSIKPKLVDLNSIIENAVKESIIPAIPIYTDYDHEMPKIEGDPQLLQMAIKNLILNAVEAIDGKGEINVTTKWNGMAFIKISDTGTGIPEDRLKTIFRPFFSMKQQGHGLGLAMVKKAVMLHQGKIEVESKIDYGSTFTIILPETLDKNKN